MLTSSHAVCCACAAGHTLQGSQAKALMPHLMTLEWGSIMHVGACNTGHISIGTVHNEQAVLSEATDLLSMLS